MTPPSDHRPGLATSFLAALPAPCQVFLFGPALLWAANPGEVQASLGALVVPWSLLALLVAALVAGVLRLVPVRVAIRGTALLLGLGAALWVQGNLLVADYGLLDGGDFDFTRHAARGPWEVALWVAILGGALLLGPRLAAHSRFVAAVLLLLGASGAVLAVAQVERSAAPAEVWEPVPPELYRLSRQRNVVHLLFDGFQSDVFAEIVEAEPELAAALDGFVFFADHAGAFPTTAVSVPAMLSGRRYDNARPIPRFVEGAVRRNSLLRALRRAGFRTRAASITPRFVRGTTQVLFPIPKPWVGRGEHLLFTAAQLVDVALFRHLPHVVKPLVVRDQRWLLQGWLGIDERQHHAGNGSAFLADWTAKLEVAEAEPVYVQVHVGLPHLPVVLDGDCRWIGMVTGDRAAYREQGRCGVRLLASLLDRLREMEIYDSSLILVTSDHGLQYLPRGAPVVDGDIVGAMIGDFPALAGPASALLAVKPLAATGPLRVSQAPTAISDFPATVLAALGLGAGGYSGTPALALDAAPSAPREREFGYYRWHREAWEDRYLRAVHRLRIDGPVASPYSWSFVGTQISPELRLPRRRLDFGSPSILDHLGLGWDRPYPAAAEGEGFTWALGGTATLLVGLPAGPSRWRARLSTPADNFPQRVDVSLDGHPLATWTLRAPEDFEEHELTIAAAAARPPVSELVLRFARHRRDVRDGRLEPRAVRWSRFEEIPSTAGPPEEPR